MSAVSRVSSMDSQVSSSSRSRLSRASSPRAQGPLRSATAAGAGGPAGRGALRAFEGRRLGSTSTGRRGLDVRRGGGASSWPPRSSGPGGAMTSVPRPGRRPCVGGRVSSPTSVSTPTTAMPMIRIAAESVHGAIQSDASADDQARMSSCVADGRQGVDALAHGVAELGHDGQRPRRGAGRRRTRRRPRRRRRTSSITRMIASMVFNSRGCGGRDSTVTQRPALADPRRADRCVDRPSLAGQRASSGSTAARTASGIGDDRPAVRHRARCRRRRARSAPRRRPRRESPWKRPIR